MFSQLDAVVLCTRFIAVVLVVWSVLTLLLLLHTVLLHVVIFAH
jgi:succinate-acetate transporter protein